MSDTTDEQKQSKLTQENKRVKIAEASGWNSKPEPSPVEGMPWGLDAEKPKWWFVHQLPDYFRDLNAVHAAVISLPEAQRFLVDLKLVEICSGSRPFDRSNYVWYANAHIVGDALIKAFNATAAQRAEALYQVITRDG